MTFVAGKTDEVAAFFAGYPPEVQAVALALRRTVRSALPRAEEMLDRSGRVVGYGFGPGYADLICTIIPSKTGVKLGIAHGAELDDPQGLLEGPGKRHRYVALAAVADLRRPGLAPLLAAALAAWKARSALATTKVRRTHRR